MKKFTLLSGLILLALMLIAPVAVRASAPQAIDVYAWNSPQPVTENDVLNYVAETYTSGYINDTHYITQSTLSDRTTFLRQMAEQSFDADYDDPFIYSILLPNSATVDNAKTWFGHPIVRNGNQYIVKGWFAKNIDANLIFSAFGDPRVGSANY
jgi:hypothetical protein